LTTNEEIITVGKSGVLGTGHGVEWSHIQWVLVHEEKVSIVLFAHNVTELLLVFSAQILVVILLAAKRNTTKQV
jgi:hypothetical protein